jgi:hypothetical protein
MIWFGASEVRKSEGILLGDAKNFNVFFLDLQRLAANNGTELDLPRELPLAEASSLRTLLSRSRRFETAKTFPNSF